MRWFKGGIYHEEEHSECSCGCHCSRVFKKVAARLNHPSTDSSISIDSITLEEINIHPVQPRSRIEEDTHCLCSSCCNCTYMEEDESDPRKKPIPHVSLFYAPPTFIRELCGITAFAGSTTCRRVSIEECQCHGLWIGFFNEVLGAYADRYTDIVFFII